MKEKPILFNSKMVKAILDGRKTQTRRIVKFPDGCDEFSCDFERGLIAFGKDDFCDGLLQIDDADYCKKFPYQVGDKLWVREPFRIEGTSKIFPNLGKVSVLYRNDNKQHFVKLTDKEFDRWENWKEPYRSKSSLLMFKSIARIWLEVIAVRVELLQDITEQDAKTEGCDKFLGGDTYSYAVAFSSLWNSINKKSGFGWENNPFVWVIEFKRIKAGEK